MSTQLTELQKGQQFIEVATGDGEVRSVLAEKRFPVDDLATGLTIIQGIKEVYARREALLGIQMRMTDEVDAEYEEVRDLDAQLRYTALVELAGRTDLLAKIGLHPQKRDATKEEPSTSPPTAAPAVPQAGPQATPPAEPTQASATGPYSIRRFIARVEPFVANVLADAEILAALAEGSFSRDEVASLATRLEALRRANVEQEKAIGATQGATRDLRAAMERYLVWYRPRRRRVKRALKGRLDLKKRLGLAA